ncbi:MAG: hypothetical protein Q9168_004388 [Polycauliona sp. 1 TL-2023]
MAPGLVAGSSHGTANGHVNGIEGPNVDGTDTEDHVTTNGSAGSTASPLPNPQVTRDHPHNVLPTNGRPMEELSTRPLEPIAIVGMAMRLPGGIHDADGLWDLLINKRSGQCRVPASRYNIDAWYGPGKRGHVGTQSGYFLEDLNLAHIDANFWSMSKREVEIMDPQQRLLLEVVYECLENAGIKDWRGKNIGCYVGIFGEDWVDMEGKDTLNSHIMTIRTACSSSLTGLHEACQALYSGECSSAIVGGTNIILTPRMTIAMTEHGVISPTGSCKSFDAGADGYARGEAVSALYIKKLSDAVRNGDPVRAVISSTCVNHDGKTVGLTTPNTEAHEALIRRGHQLAGFDDLSKTAMIECHGTGTKVGDPIEARAVANVFGEYGMYIGSIKPNLGHSEGASGISSVMKMVLALEHKTIPPNINFKTWNPEIPWESGNLKVPVNPTPWPADRAERVGVNSFGIGGANAHVLLESAASYGIQQPVPVTEPAVADRPSLLVVSAQHPESVRHAVQNHASYLASHPDSLQDMCYTLGQHRKQHLHRGFCIAQADDALELSQINKPESTPKVIFTFTGQGAQWARMGRELFTQEPTFAKSVAKLDAVLSSLAEPPSWSLQDEILKPKSKSRLSEAEISQPCCTAIQVALVDFLATWGVHPAGVVGHSSGEIVAAYAAQVITAPEAILIAYYRGLATVGLGQLHHGGMAAVGLGPQEVTTYLRNGVIVGCENSAKSVTLTGDFKVLEDIMDAIRKDQPEVLVRALHVECAYHSHHMKSVEGKYRTLLGKGNHARQPAVPIYSSVTGKVLSNGETLSTSYWVQNLTSPVLFLGAVNAALDDIKAPMVFLELGAHAALAGPIRQILRQRSIDAHYVSTLVRNQDGLKSMLTAAGELWIRNATINLGQVNPSGHLLTDLPTYAWNYENEYWYESRLSKESRQRRFAHHDILGSRVVESSDLDPVWRNVLRLDQVPWIEEHRIGGNVLFPAAGYIAMAGEAIRQLESGVDYTVRAVTFMSALIINEGHPVEMQTHLKKGQLTTSLNSEWYDFSIASLNEGSWIKHCVGQVKPGPIFTTPAPNIETLARHVPSRVWYRAMARVGLGYGPKFQGLQEISADVREQRAIATLNGTLEDRESAYQLHPITIDSAFQLASCAAYKGVGRWLTKLLVPTYMEELYVGPSKDKIIIQADAKSFPSGAINSDMVGVSAAEVVFRVKGFLLSSLGDNDEGHKDDPHAAMELVWKSDLNLLDTTRLFRPCEGIAATQALLEKLALACMIESNIRLANVSPSQAHLPKFRDWLGTRQALAVQNQYPQVPNSASIVEMDSDTRVQFIEDALAEAGRTTVAASAIAIHRIYQHCVGIYEGTTDPLNLLLEENILTKVYDVMTLMEYAEFIDLLGHSTPNMKILEIGAGTGGTTSSILPHLHSAYGEKMFGSYTYTDISAGFFVQAQERFRSFRGIEFRALDIAQDPVPQGFEPESYDLIVASNVLHATASLKDTLSNVRKLLRPRGRLFLQELDPRTKWINFVMGVLPGWWLGEADGRLTEPYVNAERWIEELRGAGFDENPSVVHDGHLLNYIIARPSGTTMPKRVTVLQAGEASPRTEAVVRSLSGEGYELDFCTLAETPIAGQDIISLLDIELPFLASATEARFVALRDFVTRCQGSGLLWITKVAQIECKDPDYAMVLGLARSLRNELSMHFATCELESFEEADSLAAMMKVLGEFSLRACDLDKNPDLEYVYSNGSVQISRVYPIKVSKLLEAPKQDCQPKKLAIDRPGILQSLNWRQTAVEALGGDDVAIEVRAVGLNFRDVLSAMGVIERVAQWGLGCESSGIVRRVGPTTKHLKVGDRVFCCSGGSFSTTSTVTELCCAPIPDSLSFLDASTMPVVYGTVIYGLMDVARLARGQTVLIHSAAGGVGIAAIQIAQMIGADIYCTVSSQEKIDFVQRNFNIPRNRIMYSRDTSFLQGILRETNGKGVDVVLNSLSGELLHASWDCVAEFGTMVEIGKRDLMGHAALSMTPFLENRTYTGVDLSRVCLNKPAIMHELLRRIIQYYTQGHIKALSPIKEFHGMQIEEAMRYMQKGQHIGKIVVSMPENPTELAATSSVKKLACRSEMSYLFVGGLGGLGRSIASWLVENGAKHLIFLSRSAGQVTSDDPFVKELGTQGCSVQTFSGSVANAEDVAKAVASAARPVAGVLQASMVLNDASMSDMNFEQWQAAVLPKVQGTWNLHHEFLKQDQPLDFFLLFSSLSGLGGQPGQSNYAAGNTFLDAFVQYRHSLGLPASVLDIGIMEDVGFVSNNASLLESLKSSSMHLLQEQDLLDSIQLMIERSSPPLRSPPGPPPSTSTTSPSTLTRAYVNPSQVAIGVRSSNAANSRSIWKRDIRMAVCRNLETGTGGTGTGTGDSDTGRLKQFLSDSRLNPGLLDVSESTTLLAEETGTTLAAFMMRGDEQLDLHVSMAALGVDSLVSIELRNWFRSKVGVDLTVLEVVNCGSLMALAEHAAMKLKEKYQARGG